MAPLLALLGDESGIGLRLLLRVDKPLQARNRFAVVGKELRGVLLEPRHPRGPLLQRRMRRGERRLEGGARGHEPVHLRSFGGELTMALVDPVADLAKAVEQRHAVDRRQPCLEGEVLRLATELFGLAGIRAGARAGAPELLEEHPFGAPQGFHLGFFFAMPLRQWAVRHHHARRPLQLEGIYSSVLGMGLAPAPLLEVALQRGFAEADAPPHRPQLPPQRPDLRERRGQARRRALGVEPQLLQLGAQGIQLMSVLLRDLPQSSAQGRGALGREASTDANGRHRHREGRRCATGTRGQGSVGKTAA
mmetsp:Transcript_161458/g.513027  ORF Transcript_161458/g.513027 Transcript_161458/m.513027 type:complete len:306 (-) Transcript_161458:16-933(-)